jgi:DNA topoisomerase-1
MILVIVESPAKCKKIESYLGPGYKCIASFGHIREIANGLKSIDVKNNYDVVFKTIASKGKYIKPLREAIKKATEVVLATDDDREGEAIAWHICKTFKLPIKSTKRIIFHEITKPAIKNAIANPTRINMNTVNAQLARQVLDLLVGFTISPILWKHISRNTEGSLSAGRCQTPALRLVYEQQKLINESPGRKVYDTTGIFTKKNLKFVLDHNYDDEEKMADFLEESANFSHKYSVSKPRITTKNPPIPFTTSTLQQKASNEYNFSPKQTMKLAQTLYENGHITYMRTDSTKYSKEFVDKAKKYIKTEYGTDYISKNIEKLVNSGSSEKKKKKKNDNNAQEAHEAIRPTKIDVSTLNVAGKITAREVKLYNLIWRNTVESCMSPAKYYSITSKISAPEEHFYKYTSEQVIFPGWKIVGGYEKENSEYKYLLKLKPDTVLDYTEIYSKITLKDLKKNFTEAKLVQMLEKKGIGRPSTFSSLISKIQDRGYVKKQSVEGKKIKCVDFRLIGEELDEIETERVFGNEKNKLVIQPTGIMVYEFLEKHFDALFNYDYTKNMEDDLDKISKGERVWHTLCHECNTQIKESSKEIKESRETYKIDKHHVYMIGRYGPVIKCEKDGETTFKNVKKDLDIEKLKNGEYKLKDVLDTTKKSGNKKCLGEFKGNEVYLMNGKYGAYINCNGKNSSISHIKKDKDDITLQDVIDVLNGKKPKNSSVLKEISEDISVRKGKYGPYVFYKTNKMKKPRFIPMKGIKVEEVTEQWVRDKL